MTDIGPWVRTYRELRRQNTRLRERVWQLKRSRDDWKRKAVARSHRISELKRQLSKRPALKQPRSGKKYRYTQRDYREHALIVERIRAIPNREL